MFWVARRARLVFAVAISGCGRTVDRITGTVGSVADWVWTSLPVPYAGEPRGDRALVIGIDLYRNPRNNLPGSVNDAHMVRHLLSKHLGFEPGQIRVLTDDQATRDGILAEIRDWLVAGTRPGARALLYYSGHGSYLPDDNGDEYDGNDEALVPHDEQYIRDDEIRTLFAQLRGRQAYLIIDSCHSGTIHRAVSVPGEPLVHPVVYRPGVGGTVRSARVRSANRGLDNGFVKGVADNLVVWTAAAASQVAFQASRRDVDEGQWRGVFTGAFVDGISKREADYNGDRRVTNEELLDYVRKETEEFCSSSTQCQRLNHGKYTPGLEARHSVLTHDVLAWNMASEE